jgi:prepilin signal peptidase PulO-like enzyme (type II secretory pathway)
MTAAAIIIVIAVAVIYTIYDPTLPWFPRCVFLQLTGLQCPGCGSQRALHALLTGSLIDAWHFNAMVIILIPIALLAAVGNLMGSRMSRLNAAFHSPRIIMAIAVAIVVWWIARNLL